MFVVPASAGGVCQQSARLKGGTTNTLPSRECYILVALACHGDVTICHRVSEEVHQKAFSQMYFWI
jgi:hypothetical protein